MSKLPVVSSKELEKILLKLGFEISRQKGSQNFINIQTEDTQLSLTILAKIFHDH